VFFMSPRVSILIVNYNTRELLKKCLQSIFETKGELSVEVLIWDNNSSDGSGEMVARLFPQANLMPFQQNTGYTRAMNALLAAAQGEYLLLLHPDVELFPGTLQGFLDFFCRHGRAGVLGGNLYYPDGTPNPCEILFPGFRNDLKCFLRKLWFRLPSFAKRLAEPNPLEWNHEKTSQVNWVWNACMMVHRKVFEDIGLFDEDFFVWFADWDFCKRATDAGWAVYYLDSAKAVHHERQSPAQLCTEEVIYKVDGRYSAPRMYSDRCRFLRKHCNGTAILALKGLHVFQYALQVSRALTDEMKGHMPVRDACWDIKLFLKTMKSILGA